MIIVGTYTRNGAACLISGASGVDADRIRQDIAATGGDPESFTYAEAADEAEAWLTANTPADMKRQNEIAAIKAELAGLDAKYYGNLSTLINAQTGDAEALAVLNARRTAHEAEAEPLRARLGELTG